MNTQTEELYDACAQGDPEKVKQALAKGPNVNSDEFGSGFTPLHVCVSGTYHQEERQEIIRLLHRAGAKLETKDMEKGLTPLHYAALRNKPLCAEILLQCGANVHATEANGATALHGAAFHGHAEVAKVLLTHGADPMREDTHGHTPLSLARSQGHVQVEQLLSSQPTPTRKPWWRFWK